MNRMLLVLLCLALAFPGTTAWAMEQLAYYPADNLENVVDTKLLALDANTSQDGKGALRIETTEPVTVQLYEVGDVDVEDARLMYQAALRCQDLQGQAYLEMLCQFKELGTYFSRALHAPISGDSDWVVQETPFFLQTGQNPTNVKLNLVITGPGTVWVDAIRLMRLPLQ